MTLLESPTITKVVTALIDAQAEFDPAVKRATNPAFHSKYADLGSVMDAVSPSLVKHRIALLQQTYVDAEGRVHLLTRLIHESGEWLGSLYPVRPVAATPQGEGSALTYARRYSVLAICGIAPEDDDGNAASAGRQNGGGPEGQTDNPGRRVVTSEVVQLQQQILAIAERKHLSKEEVIAEFDAWKEARGMAVVATIGNSNAVTLQAFVAHLLAEKPPVQIPGQGDLLAEADAARNALEDHFLPADGEGIGSAEGQGTDRPASDYPPVDPPLDDTDTRLARARERNAKHQ